jgi:hypothetical protein
MMRYGADEGRIAGLQRCLCRLSANNRLWERRNVAALIP